MESWMNDRIIKEPTGKPLGPESPTYSIVWEGEEEEDELPPGPAPPSMPPPTTIPSDVVLKQPEGKPVGLDAPTSNAYSKGSAASATPQAIPAAPAPPGSPPPASIPRDDFSLPDPFDNPQGRFIEGILDGYGESWPNADSDEEDDPDAARVFTRAEWTDFVSEALAEQQWGDRSGPLTAPLASEEKEFIRSICPDSLRGEACRLGQEMPSRIPGRPRVGVDDRTNCDKLHVCRQWRKGNCSQPKQHGVLVHVLPTCRNVRKGILSTDKCNLGPACAEKWGHDEPEVRFAVETLRRVISSQRAAVAESKRGERVDNSLPTGHHEFF
ncbi:uncharacterized protein J3D65DRAFT_642518 [Phyllosticta citribraziliensis]|uniref:Uncharacterized protein n=1 Tax=Phyllosticta citribraziliensis TaxID=989973 RepID=A0ABR1L2Z8_9PEZI